MNKTVSINLGGWFFHIVEEAYQKLENYLNTLQQYFANEEGGSEIMEDIELRIAEMFQENLNANKRQVVLMTDIELVINKMGLPEQISEPLGESSAFEKTHKESTKNNYNTAEEQRWQQASSEQSSSKRLYRNPDDKFIGGVCSGLSAYFGISDPIWIRLLFVAILFFGGGSIPIYILLWVLLPEAVTPAQKLAMRGEDITISNIERIFKDGVDNLKNSFNDFNESEPGKKTRSFFSQAGAQTRKTVPTLVYWALQILRLFVIAVGLVVAFALAISLIALIVGAIFSVGFLTDFIFTSIVPLLIGLISMILIIAIPFFVIGYFIVNRSFRLRSNNSAKWVLGMGVLWIASIISLSVVAGNTYQNNFAANASLVENLAFDQPDSDTLYISTIASPHLAQLKQAKKNNAVRFDVPIGNFLKTYVDKKNNNIVIEDVQLNIEKSSTNDFSLVKKVAALSGNNQKATEIAQQIDYSISQNDTGIQLNSFFTVPYSNKWRNQTMDLTLKVPEGKTIVLDKNMAAFVSNIPAKQQASGSLWNTPLLMEEDGLQATALTTNAELPEQTATAELNEQEEEALANKAEQEDAIANQTEQNEIDNNTTALEEEIAEQIVTEVIATENKDSTYYSDYKQQQQTTSYTVPSNPHFDMNIGKQKTFTNTNFDAIDISGIFKIHIVEGNDYAITFAGDRNDLDKIELKQKGSNLSIGANSGWSLFGNDNIGPINAYIQLPNLAKLQVSGVVKAVAHCNNNYQNQLTIDGSGASKINITIPQARQLSIDLSGATKLTLNGNSENIDMDLSGASKLTAIDCITQNMEADLSGASKAEVHVTNSMNADLSGASKLSYVGKPTNVSSETSGAASINPVN